MLAGGRQAPVGQRILGAGGMEISGVQTRIVAIVWLVQPTGRR